VDLLATALDGRASAETGERVDLLGAC
jgi:hypothetical protein